MAAQKSQNNMGKGKQMAKKKKKKWPTMEIPQQG